jgi:hypothetical protein
MCWTRQRNKTLTLFPIVGRQIRQLRRLSRVLRTGREAKQQGVLFSLFKPILPPSLAQGLATAWCQRYLLLSDARWEGYREYPIPDEPHCADHWSVGSVTGEGDSTIQKSWTREKFNIIPAMPARSLWISTIIKTGNETKPRS